MRINGSVFYIWQFYFFIWLQLHKFFYVSNVVNCPVGSYQDSVLNKCVPCPKGTYQDVDGQTKCMSCPPLTSTRNDGGAKSISGCKGTFDDFVYANYFLIFANIMYIS